MKSKICTLGIFFQVCIFAFSQYVLLYATVMGYAILIISAILNAVEIVFGLAFVVVGWRAISMRAKDWSFTVASISLLEIIGEVYVYCLEHFKHPI